MRFDDLIDQGKAQNHGPLSGVTKASVMILYFMSVVRQIEKSLQVCFHGKDSNLRDQLRWQISFSPPLWLLKTFFRVLLGRLHPSPLYRFLYPVQSFFRVLMLGRVGE